MNQYDEIKNAVDVYLAEAGIGFSVTHVGLSTNSDKWQHDSWRVTFNGGRAVSESFDYRTGTGLRAKPSAAVAQHLRNKHGRFAERSAEWIDARKPVKPRAADVLQCLVNDAAAATMTFNAWCNEYGYDNDSRKAESIYRECQAAHDKLRKIFTVQQIAHIGELTQDL